MYYSIFFFKLLFLLSSFTRHTLFASYIELSSIPWSHHVFFSSLFETSFFSPHLSSSLNPRLNFFSFKSKLKSLFLAEILRDCFRYNLLAFFVHIPINNTSRQWLYWLQQRWDIIGSHRKYCGILYFAQRRLLLWIKFTWSLLFPKKVTRSMLCNIIAMSHMQLFN